MQFCRFLSASFLNLKGGYAGTSVGMLWQPISVAFVVLVLFLVFRENGSHNVSYLLYLSTGYWVWQWFSMVLGDGADQFRVKRVHLDRPSWTLVDFMLWCTIDRLTRHFIATSILLAIILTLGGVAAISFIVICYVFIFIADVCLSFILSSVSLVFKDFRFALGLASRVLFFLTPIFWGYGAVPEASSFRGVAISVNPVANLMNGFRKIVGVSGIDVHWELVVVWLLLMLILVAAIAKAAPRDWRNYQ